MHEPLVDTRLDGETPRSAGGEALLRGATVTSALVAAATTARGKLTTDAAAAQHRAR